MNRKQRGMKRLAAAILVLLLLMTTAAAPAALAETFSAIVTVEEMLVYRDAKLQAQAGTLPKDTVVRVKSYSGKAAKISYSDKTGYAPVSDMKSLDDVAKKAVVNTNARMFKKPGGDGKAQKVKKGARVYVIAKSGKWARVEQDGSVGYMKLSVLTEADDNWQTAETAAATATPAPETAKKGTVTSKKLPVYKKANAKSGKVCTLKQGQVVDVLKWNDKWARVSVDGKTGYCAVKGLAKGEQASTDATPAPSGTPATAAKKLNIYKKASSDSSKKGTLKAGDAVNILRTKGKWAYIDANGTKGYVSAAGLSTGEADDAATPSLDQAVKAAVSAESATVYKLASDSSEELGTLMWGEQVNVLSVTGKWAYVERNGKFGFCAKSALTKTQADPSDAPSDYKKAKFKATVVYPGAKVYERASTSSKGKKLKLGKEVKVTAYSRNLEWACVTNGKGRGFVPVKHLSRGKYSPVTGNGSALQTLLKGLLTYGYYDGVPTTNYNTAAITAIKRFQAACGLLETGLADTTTQRILFAGYAPADPLLSKTMNSKSSGADVKRVQLRLYALGYLAKAESIDSNYGKTTATAVGLFQRSNGIEVTCVADPATLKALYSTAATSRPSSVKAADEGGSIGIGEVLDPQGNVKLSSTYVTTMPEELKSTTSSDPGENASAGQRLEYAIYNAQENLGKPYVYGSTGPSSFDCSGLSTYAFRKIGVSLKRSAYSQGYDSGYDKIEGVSNLKRGDLVFFNTISDSDLSDHVGIYLGGGCFIHASSGGHKVVVSNLTTGFYNRVFSWGRRVLK
ncbi:MAG: SH3 domain-containing protein [Clostridia bacterium]|nr:SH3 domain-containing protein [Clostridia bacterium]